MSQSVSEIDEQEASGGYDAAWSEENNEELLRADAMAGAKDDEEDVQDGAEEGGPDTGTNAGAGSGSSLGKVQSADNPVGGSIAGEDWKAELARQKAETEALRKRLEVALAEKAPAPDAETMEALPPELEEEFRELAAKYPDLAPLARERSVLGEGIRKRLETFGADEAADYAAPAWEARRVRQDAERRSAEQTRHDAERYARDFQNTVFGAAPDFKAAMESGQGPQYLADVESWAKGKPYEEASRLLTVIENGTAAETLRLLDQFRAERQNGKNTTVAVAAAAMAAVPGHQQPLGIRPGPRKGDYDAAWDEKD